MTEVVTVGECLIAFVATGLIAASLLTKRRGAAPLGARL